MPIFHAPRKRFGQHFLHDGNIIAKIVSSIAPQKNDCMIEIGPGRGAITQLLLKHLEKLTVIELDRDLIPFLNSLSSADHQIHVIEKDVLTVNFSELIQNHKKMRIIGNLPYNISTPLIFHLLKWQDSIQDMVFMLQKEVVDRMQAQPGSKTYGRLSVMLQYHCEVEALFDVSKHAFTPPPQVESSIVRIIPKEKLLLPAQNFNKFTEIVRVAFSARRKVLRNALKNYVPLEVYEKLNINANLRPEELSVEEFVALSNQ